MPRVIGVADHIADAIAIEISKAGLATDATIDAYIRIFIPRLNRNLHLDKLANPSVPHSCRGETCHESRRR